MPPPDSPARLKRLARVAKGVQACRDWLEDRMRVGLTAPSSLDPDSFETMAARMVDYQAPGIVRKVRQLGEIQTSGIGWETRLLEEMGLLYAFLDAFDKREEFPEPLHQEILRAVGITIEKKDIPEENRFVDTWHVAIQRVFQEDRVIVQRSWIYGGATNLWQLHLSFSVADRPFDPDLKVGQAFRGQIGIFPGSSELRAAVFSAEPAEFEVPPAGTIRSMQESYAALLSRFPWTEVSSAAVEIHALEQTPRGWLAIDGSGDRVELIGRELGPWRIAAFLPSGPVKVFGEWDGRAFRAITMSAGGGFAIL